MLNRSVPSRRILRVVAGFFLAAVTAAPFLQAQETAAQNASAQALVAQASTSQSAPAQSTTTSQSAPAAAPKNYTLSGSTSFGYRFVDVEGNHAKYNELLNLQQGFRVFDGEFTVQSTQPGHGLFDRLSVSAQGLGGDPYPVIRADIRKNGQYDLRLSYRASQYVYDLPQTDLTPNRAWNDRRRFADADLRYTPTRNLQLRFFYNRTERAGTDFATSPFFYSPLAPDVVQALGRFDTVPWIVPLREEANLFGGGLDYRLGKTDFHVEQSYRTYNSPSDLTGFANQPITLRGSLTPSQNLVVQKWNTLSAFNVATTTIHVDHEVDDRVLLRAGYIYSRASGPASLDGAILQPGPNSFTLNYTGNGNTKLTVQTATAGFDLRLFGPFDLISDYRYQNYSERNTESLEASRADLPAPVSVANDALRWDYGVHTVDTVLALNPLHSLNIRAGLRFLKEDIVRKTNGQIDDGTQRTWSYSPLINFGWTPGTKFSLRGNFEARVIVDPYVRIAPEHTIGTTLRSRLYLSSKWGIDDTFAFRNLKTEAIGFISHVRSNSTSLWFQPLAKLGFQGGFTYNNFSSQDSIQFLSGIPPLTGLSTDQTIDRIWSAGLKINPASTLTLQFTGQFIRSTGLGSIYSEPSMYGPLTWPAWSAEIGYTTKHVGRVVFAWNRSYYLENLFRAVDYSANAFTLRFERTF